MALLVAGGITAAAIAVAGGYGFYRMMRGKQQSPVQDEFQVDSDERPLEDDVNSGIGHDSKVSVANLSNKPTVNFTSQGEEKSELEPVSDHEKTQAESESSPSTFTGTPQNKQTPPVVTPKPPASKHGTTTKGVPPVAPKPLVVTQQHRKPMAPISPNAIPVLPVAFGARGNLKKIGSEGIQIYQATENGPMKGNTGGEEVPVTFEEPVKTPKLKSPSRNKGPSNRRPPSRH